MKANCCMQQTGNLLIGTLKKTTDKRQRVLIVTVRIIPKTLGFYDQRIEDWVSSSGSAKMKVDDWVQFKVCPGVQARLDNMTPRWYLPSLDVRPLSTVPSWSPSPGRGRADRGQPAGLRSSHTYELRHVRGIGVFPYTGFGWMDVSMHLNIYQLSNAISKSSSPPISVNLSVHQKRAVDKFTVSNCI